MSNPFTNDSVDVLVLGAGMAGLAAARALAEGGVSVLVLEARHRVGGRVFSEQTDHGVVIEHGAEFIHGRPPALLALLEECGAQATERDGSMLRENCSGGLSEDEEQGDAFDALSALENWSAPDMPFAEWLERSGLPADEREVLTGFVEGFNAADARRIGVKALGVQQAAEDANEGDRAWHVQGGYATLPEYLADRVRQFGGTILLEERIQSVDWSRGLVEVKTQNGVFRGRKCIVALPLGVLQQNESGEGGVRFTPKAAALQHEPQLAMGPVVRFTLVFRERWWERSGATSRESLRRMSFLFTPQRMPPVWWTRRPEPEAAATLVGWVGGTRAAVLAGKTSAELGDEACKALAEVFQMDEVEIRSSLMATYTHDWTADAFSRGAYSYVPAGAIDASAAMCLPEANTLFFAGEHTDVTGNWGTVHAALGSGLRAARQILGWEADQ